ncbi:lytic polysaccharide monooxygenase [Cedecea sp. NFIX57]|uniref:lytic polysaccharide monooxygenase n=1 Tax=Cedecea sp. NFIX57 TaxID=1566286 RepID=UPI000A0E900C|nr:lytic polysaccharide monooxygenase [Cedecea sp. NFIX57]SMG61119.1 chitin-binding protein [Cedecea sp. NFIX57]
MNTITSKLFGVAITLSLCTGVTQQALAHGYVSMPESRSLLCNKGINTGCGAVQYEPQSVEGVKGFPTAGPVDGVLASGGNSRFPELNQQSATRWSKVTLHPGNNTFVWTLTARHKTTSWRYFITKQGWDSSKPLSRGAFELTPFCQINGNENLPGSSVSHSCVVPAGHTGYHVILAVWDIADTGNAFYQAIDTNIVR